MELPDLPEPAPRADAGTDALAPSYPPDRGNATPARPFPWPSSIQTPPSPDAIDNARRGTWVTNDYLDGWTLMGANGRPVMRDDGSRVAFWFRDIDRLAREWAPTEDGAPPTTKRRPGLAALNSGFDGDWDPAIGRSYRADVTKSARLLAYYFAQRTEPEEAVRRAVAMLLDDPVMVKEGNIDAFVPKRFNLAAAKAVAEAMWSDLVGSEPAAELPEPNALDITAVAEDRTNVGRETSAGPGQTRDADREAGSTDLDGQENEDDRRTSTTPFLARLLNPIARISLAQADQWDAIQSGSFEPDRLLAPATTIQSITSEILNDPYASEILAGIGSVRGRTARIRTDKLIQMWETAKGRKWPIDPDTGRNMVASHKRALADGGTNSIRNIEPLTRREHIRRHIEAGDFSRWAKRHRRANRRR